ncbi:Hsp20/alpha crystallin family protein [Desulfoferrobacter suflitae]|uniref:Hsp20/alpha crystallin family protein n=1 Tax=Desulfoferrobacter suflitae TaxID=2865782 RepID=UPI002164E188|nr:Hsp20/alpha crystallin family protein [Desulfoferrobacter suflitae]MCK8600931.1 Hsp20/alpha crystallin family protein [Desulfoferrobacter suflitae]
MTDKDLQVQEKQELQTKSESTRNVPIFVPAVDIYESENELTLLADMPGVPIGNVDIDLNDDQLTIRGTAPEQEQSGTALLREYSVGDYYRQFTVSSAIDREKIVASMKDGVLKLVLPKAEAAKPRKIEVKTA